MARKVVRKVIAAKKPKKAKKIKSTVVTCRPIKDKRLYNQLVALRKNWLKQLKKLSVVEVAMLTLKLFPKHDKGRTK